MEMMIGHYVWTVNLGINPGWALAARGQSSPGAAWSSADAALDAAHVAATDVRDIRQRLLFARREHPASAPVRANDGPESGGGGRRWTPARAPCAASATARCAAACGSCCRGS